MVLETGVALPFVFLRGPFFPSKGERKQGRERKYKLPFGRVVRARGEQVLLTERRGVCVKEFRSSLSFRRVRHRH